MRTIPGVRDDVSSMTPGAIREAFSLRRPAARRRPRPASSAPPAAQVLFADRADLPPVWVALLRLVAFLAVLVLAVSGMMAVAVYGIVSVLRGLTGGAF